MIINNKILNIDDYYYSIFITISESLPGFPVNELQSASLAVMYYKHIFCQNGKVMNRMTDYDTFKPNYEMIAFEIRVSKKILH